MSDDFVYSVLLCTATKFELITVRRQYHFIANSIDTSKSVLSLEIFAKCNHLIKSLKFAFAKCKINFIKYHSIHQPVNIYPISFLKPTFSSEKSTLNAEYIGHQCQRVKYSWTLHDLIAIYKWKRPTDRITMTFSFDSTNKFAICVCDKQKPWSQIVIWLFVYYLRCGFHSNDSIYCVYQRIAEITHVNGITTMHG